MAEPLATGASAAKFIAGLRPGYTTKRHNRIVEREYEDRYRWLHDQIQREAEALRAVEQEMAERNLTFSGARGKRENDVRRTFAQQWRDRKSEGDRRIEDARDAETPLHAGWRSMVGRPWPEDEHADEIARLTRGWEDVHGRYGSGR
jgi:hypothetical protein